MRMISMRYVVTDRPMICVRNGERDTREETHARLVMRVGFLSAMDGRGLSLQWGIYVLFAMHGARLE